MRITDPGQDDGDLVDDGWVAGPIIIVPAEKAAPLAATAPRPSARRERLARAGYALGGAAVTLLLTLAATGLRERGPWAGRPDAGRDRGSAASTAPLVLAREAAFAQPRASGVSPVALAALPASNAGVLVPGVLVMAESPAVEHDVVVDDVAELLSAAELPSIVEPAGSVLATPAVLLSSGIAIRPASASPTGAWYHTDVRARNADSLVITLLADGSVTAFEKRWSIGDRGWHAETTERRGRWVEDNPRRAKREVCIEWTSPDSSEACAQFITDRGEMRMNFGGRHWQRAACVAPRQESDALTETGAPVPQRDARTGTT